MFCGLSDNGGSNFASHAAFASSSHADFSAWGESYGTRIGGERSLASPAFRSASHALLTASSQGALLHAPAFSSTSSATSESAAAAASQEGTSRRASQSRLAIASLDSVSQATSSPESHCSFRSTILPASATADESAAAALPHVGASSFASHACFASSSDMFGSAATSAIAFAALTHDGASSRASHARFASSSCASISHAMSSPVSQAFSKVSIAAASFATRLSAAAALPHIGVSSFVSQARFASSSDASTVANTGSRVAVAVRCKSSSCSTSAFSLAISSNFLWRSESSKVAPVPSLPQAGASC